MRHALRIVVWTSAGFVVSAGWGFYFAATNKDIPVRLIVYALATLTQPAVAVFVYFNSHSVGLRAVEIANAVTYAFVGLIVESIGRSQIFDASNRVHPSNTQINSKLAPAAPDILVELR